MMPKKIIALLFVFCISLQMLPFKEMGAMIFKSGFIEELCNASSGNEEIKNLNDSSQWEATGFWDIYSLEVNTTDYFKNVIRNSTLASRCIDEPPTRPPLI
jgi:hypothetical protein